MELHKAIKEIVASKGAGMINNIQIINFLLDYQAFKEKPATKLILRDVINAGYGEFILALQNVQGWQTKFNIYQQEFIDSFGYNENLVTYVFDSIAYAVDLIDSDIIKKLPNRNKERQVNHLMVKNISITGSVDNFLQKLVELGGTIKRTYDPTQGNALVLCPFMSYSNCSFYVRASVISKTVYSVTIELPDILYWPALEDVYKECKGILTKKYGNPTYCKEVLNEVMPQEVYKFVEKYSSTEGQLRALAEKDCEYHSAFKCKAGEIHLYIFIPRVTIVYNDSINSKLKGKEDKQAAYDDI